MSKSIFAPIALVVAIAIAPIATVSNVHAEVISVSIESVGGGTFNTPVFVGFHDGSFDLFDGAAPASTALERLAEDGNNSVLGDDFAAAGFTGGNVGGGPIAPGQTVSSEFTIDPSASNRLLLATMVLPTNDWFLGANDPDAFDISDLANGPLTFELNRLYDAGTEVNDFGTSAGNGLIPITGGQTGPNEGLDENGSVQFLGLIGANGELTSPTGSINANPFEDFANLPADFNPALSSLRVTVSQVAAVPEPTSMTALAAIGVVGWVGRRRSRRSKKDSAASIA